MTDDTTTWRDLRREQEGLQRRLEQPGPKRDPIPPRQLLALSLVLLTAPVALGVVLWLL